MVKGRCSVCDKIKSTVYTVGRVECRLFVCLPCVKNCDYVLRCTGCGDRLCYATGGSIGGDEAFCTDCHSGSVNLECHACGADIGYHADRESMRYNEGYCFDCIEKPNKKRVKQ
jgi:hypothetical protein